MTERKIKGVTSWTGKSQRREEREEKATDGRRTGLFNAHYKKRGINNGGPKKKGEDSRGRLRRARGLRARFP